jgi:hypothetical protein
MDNKQDYYYIYMITFRIDKYPLTVILVLALTLWITLGLASIITIDSNAPKYALVQQQPQKSNLHFQS